ncbi:RNA-binding cell elongation regulator Jag/EloR [uncultured Phascolarctobacterium sp.]|uniref:RNA-binding cell elongation regulator Jag/EloR n=1 Tax=uncultured Phascolarctobacterium sp. TaxID=512296 RepID=UPI0025E9C06B|nr:RNA-binding cell elongation regulator Jag/EloR [uncultured Phascolarctobacterium sp.]
MAFVEKTGKSVDEAVAVALAELKVTADQAVVEVLEEAKKGFLGFGRKDARVRVSVKPAEAEIAEAAPAAEKTVSEAAADAVAAVKEAAVVAAGALAKKADAVKADAAVAAEDFKKKAADAKDDAVDDAIAALNALKSERRERQTREPRKYNVSDEAVAAAKEFLQKIFNAMHIEVAMEKFINKNDGSVTFRLHGDDMGILIGKHGQTLDSLQYLTNLVANKNSNERVRVIIDVEDYRDRRIETLNRLAARLADKVKRTGERVALEPMNPHERKIIHMALQGDRRVTTLSEGDEPYRHVVIELKK